MDESLRFVARLLDGETTVDVLCHLAIFALINPVFPE
jgi:hypothetical protein